jgi:exosortase
MPEESPIEKSHVPMEAWPWPSWGMLIAGGVIAFRPLSFIWSSSPSYSFGWLVPLLALFLFVERWHSRPAREASSLRFPLAPLLVVWVLLFLVFRLAVETEPDWRPLLWIIVGLYLAALVGWLWLDGGRPWVRHFSFPVAFLILSLPWPYDIEYPLVQGLMRLNARLVAASLDLEGIPANAMGNVIQLANCRLGVEEACSGIISLQASVVLAFLLGELYRLSWKRRGALVFLGLIFALVGNYGRTLFLAFIASQKGIEVVGRWHDIAGFSILVFSGVGLWLACLFLRPKMAPPSARTPPSDSEANSPRQALIAFRVALIVFLACAAAETITQVWFGWKESKKPLHPEWTLALPASGGVEKIALAEVTRHILQCDFYAGGKWRDAQGWVWMAYWFKYLPRQTNNAILTGHTPDICLPATGLSRDKTYPVFTAQIKGLHFLVEPRRFSIQQTPLYVFWIVYVNQGDAPSESDNLPDAAISSRVRSILRALSKGRRGVGAETLEIAVAGPTTYEAAKSAYLDQLTAVVTPDAVTAPASESFR